MNARARKARAIIRQERRRRREEKQRARARAYVVDRRRRSIEAQRAAGLYPFPAMDVAARRIEALFRHYSVADGIAYIPADDVLPPSPAHMEQIGPSGGGKTFWGPDAWEANQEGGQLRLVPTGLPPINGAYWMGADLDQGDAPRDPVELQERITADDVDQEDQ